MQNNTNTQSDNEATTLLPAPLWKRLFAMLYDTFLLFGLTMIYGYPATYITTKIKGVPLEALEQSGKNAGNPIMFIGWLLVIYLFFFWFWSRNQQTLGMQAWRLKIYSDNHQPLSHKQTLIRLLVAPFSFGLLGAGFVWCLFGTKRTWQDIASGSQIVQVPK